MSGDTRGPGAAGFRRLLEQLTGRTETKAVRDRALLRLLFDLGLRRSEGVRLDLADEGFPSCATPRRRAAPRDPGRSTAPRPDSVPKPAYLGHGSD